MAESSLKPQRSLNVTKIPLLDKCSKSDSLIFMIFGDQIGKLWIFDMVLLRKNLIFLPVARREDVNVI